MWEVIYIRHFEEWWLRLPEHHQRRVLVRIEALKASGPELGRPTVDTIIGSRHSNMKELSLNPPIGGLWGGLVVV